MKNTFKNTLTLATMLISLIGFSQDNNSETDSIFHVTPNSISENNYYLELRTEREFAEFNERASLELKWKKIPLETLWTDCNNFELQPGDTLICNKKDGFLNGIWYLKRPWVSIKGEFIDGLSNGEWDKIQKGRNGTTHIHQEFNHGVPNGEWYEEIDGIKIQSFFFNNGKPNGLWTTFLRKDELRASSVYNKIEINYKNGVRNGLTVFSKDNIVKCSFNYVNGIMEGKFTAHGDFFGC